MSTAQQQALAFYAAVLSSAVCLVFLPVTMLAAIAILCTSWGLLVAFWLVVSRRAKPEVTLKLDDLPDPTFRHPIVLVCGDLSQVWPRTSQVLTVTQGCWIQVEYHQDLTMVARQVLLLRPDWGRQLSVMVSVCPQKHVDSEVLTSRLLSLRWQLSQLRKETGHSVPLVLNGQIGCAMMNDIFWQSAISGKGNCVWRESSDPCSIGTSVTIAGAMDMQQQVLMNSLVAWFNTCVKPVFMDENPDVPATAPTAMIWGMGPSLTGSLETSIWTVWLSRHTAMQQVTGWQPVRSDSTVASFFPDFVMTLLPEGQGLTPRARMWCCALGVFTIAALTSLLSSGWSNHQLLHRVSFDIAHYDRISMDDYGPKAGALAVLRNNAAQLDGWARNGVPARLSLGLYQGEFLRMPVLEAIRSYVPQPPHSKSKPKPMTEPEIIRLDSMSLFDTGKSVLKTGSTKMLVKSLVDIKARSGWLIVVTGHTDNTGNAQLNQTLSQKRAEAVRDWMRDTGSVPESCFAVQGYGASLPVATNDTSGGRALNRRVEISLVPQVNACQIPGKTQSVIAE